MGAVEDLLRRLIAEKTEETQDGCWRWTGSDNGVGYGKLYLLVHRVAWMLAHDEPLDGRVLRHACDNPSCHNPDHLLAGTQQENMADCIARGRGNRRALRGDAHPATRISEDDAERIRERYRAGGVLQRELAEEFGVAQSHISKIVRGELGMPRAVPTAPRNVFSQDLIAQVQQRRREGASLRALVEEFGISKSSAARMVRAMEKEN